MKFISYCLITVRNLYEILEIQKDVNICEDKKKKAENLLVTCRETSLEVNAEKTKYSRIQIIRKLVIRIANNPNWLGTTGKFVKNFKKLTCLEITDYQIKYNAFLWLLEL